jgi:hypothetical protein
MMRRAHWPSGEIVTLGLGGWGLELQRMHLMAGYVAHWPSGRDIGIWGLGSSSSKTKRVVFLFQISIQVSGQMWRE